MWTSDAEGNRWCVGPSQLSWTRPLAVLPCDDPKYRTPPPGTHDDCHISTCNYVSGFDAVPVQCVGIPKAEHCSPPDLGGVVGEGCSLRLQCESGVISGIRFADFGVISGDNATCASYRSSNCTSGHTALEIVEDLCVGKQKCDILASVELFGDPCRYIHKTLAVWAHGCAPDLTATDPMYMTLPSVTGGLPVAYDNVEYGSGPLPHVRYIGGQKRFEGYWTFEEADLRSDRGTMLRAGYGKIRDDDGVGGVDLADANIFCMEAMHGGNLETWWSSLSGGRHAVALFNRSPSPDSITVNFETLEGLNQTLPVHLIKCVSNAIAVRCTVMAITALQQHQFVMGVRTNRCVP